MDPPYLPAQPQLFISYNLQLMMSLRRLRTRTRAELFNVQLNAERVSGPYT